MDEGAEGGGGATISMEYYLSYTPHDITSTTLPYLTLPYLTLPYLTLPYRDYNSSHLTLRIRAKVYVCSYLSLLSQT